MKTATSIKNIRRVVIVFIILLALSGITAFPLVTEVDFMLAHINSFPVFFHDWIRTVYQSVHETPSIVLYGTDWLAFAHIIIGLFLWVCIKTLCEINLLSTLVLWLVLLCFH